MQTTKVFTVTDLGGGDGGKGGVVHKLCEQFSAHTVIKVGGAQGCHGVRTKAGQQFNFSQLGCGTFGGSKTHLSPLFTMDPTALLTEADELRYRWGVSNIFTLLTADKSVLCSTVYHMVASQLRELARKGNQKGTVGTGVGEAAADAEAFPELAIRAGDLSHPKLLKEKLAAVQQQKIRDLEAILAGDFYNEDRPGVTALEELLRSPHVLTAVTERLTLLGQNLQVTDDDYLGEVLHTPGTVVVESSHGVLTDRYHGFHPHTTRLRTLPQFTWDMLRGAGFTGKIHKLGLTRAYSIRHGAGPMVTEDPSLLPHLLPGSSKDENRWQGKVRVGALDFVALRYAIEVCGGPTAFDGLAVTWFDQVETFGSWKYCSRYTEPGNLTCFTESREIRVRRGQDADQLDHQERLGKILRGLKPVVTTYDLPQDRQESMNYVTGVIRRETGVPVKLLSVGPTEEYKLLL